MDKIKVSAPGRIDLSGGATDWCGMHTLAMAIDLRAYVEIEKLENPNLVKIEIGDLYEEYEEPKYGTGLDLFKAVIELSGLKGFSVKYRTDIPKGSGLGGSAPLTVSTLYALNELFEKGWNKYFYTELAQRAETLKLHMVNGCQDQYTAAFGGLIFMDFEGKECQKDHYSKPVDQEPYAVVEDLTEYYPDFHIVVAIPEITRVSSGQTNGSVSERYLNGDVEIVTKMKEKARLTQDAKKALVNGEIEKLYDLINKNNEIMRVFGFVSEENEKIISTAVENGAIATKTCGAGRGAVALFARNPEDRDKIFDAVKFVSKDVFKVEMDEGVRIER